MQPAAHEPGPATAGGHPRLALLQAVADPLRLALLAELVEPAAVHELCSRLQLAQPRVSHHLGILRRAGLVELEVHGREHRYQLAAPAPGDPRRELLAFVGVHGGGVAPPPAPRAPATGKLEDFLL